MPEIKADFSYYGPVNNHQAEFHASKAQHKLLIGGYGSGKTYPSIHESIFMCFDNPGHEFLVCRNTWDSLTENVEKEFLQVCEQAGVVKEWNKTKHDLVLICDTTVRFRPLTMARAQFKGLNICGFFLDDPDVHRHKETISFLFSRLRNSPRAKAKYFKTIITANYEGHNWLWQTYMRNRDPGGDDKFAYWICPTKDNPELPEGFIEDLKAVHSESWIKRFVECDLDSYSGLIYDEFRPDVHEADLSWIEAIDNEGNYEDDRADGLTRILACDVGVTDPTVVLDIATDGSNMYVYNEFYRPNIRVNVLGEYMVTRMRRHNYRAVVIDRAAKKTDQVHGQSVDSTLRLEYGINPIPSHGEILWGIELLKGVMSVNKDKSHFFIDPEKCPMTCREIDIYSWKEPDMSEFDELAYKEVPIDKDNHCMDAMRYGATFLKKFMRGMYNNEGILADRRQKLWEMRKSKMKIYKRDGRGFDLDPDMQHLVDIHRKKKVKYTHQRGRHRQI